MIGKISIQTFIMKYKTHTVLARPIVITNF